MYQQPYTMPTLEELAYGTGPGDVPGSGQAVPEQQPVYRQPMQPPMQQIPPNPIEQFGRAMYEPQQQNIQPDQQMSPYVQQLLGGY